MNANPSANLSDLPAQVAEFARRSVAIGLNQGTSGNVSARSPEGFWITPSGRDMSGLAANDIVEVPMQAPSPLRGEGRGEGGAGEAGQSDGTTHPHPTPSPLKGEGPRPSSEWRFHRDIYAAFPQARAVVHAHSPFAVALACLRRDLPPFHYMVAMAGGSDIRCAAYATFGTQALSDAVVTALQDRRACLMANHGLVAWGASLDAALALAVEVEALCGQYLRACQVGEPVLLSAAEMAEVLERFKDYGARR
ncbi:MAG: class II aldolase/adducin family protein [Pseudomonadota bacterium]